MPLEVYVSTFAQIRFEPSGMTNDADIRVAKSIVDYIFRWMGKRFPLGRGPGGGRDPVA